MGDAVSGIVAIVLALLVSVGIPTLAYVGGRYNTMQQAFDRGYAVQCVGKVGYYWECEK